MYQYLAGSLENQVCRFFHYSFKIEAKNDVSHFYKRCSENLAMKCFSCKIDNTQFLSSGLTLNTFKDHENNLLFILVYTEIK